MEVRRILIGFCHRQHFGFTVKLSQKSQAERRARASTFYLAIFPHMRLGRIISTEAVRQDDCRMSGEIRISNCVLNVARQSHPPVRTLLPQFHRCGTGAIGLNVFHRRDKPSSAECVWPVIFCLLSEQLVAAAAREVIKSGRSFRQKECCAWPRKDTSEIPRESGLRPIERELGQRGFFEFTVILAANMVSARLAFSSACFFFSSSESSFSSFAGDVCCGGGCCSKSAFRYPRRSLRQSRLASQLNAALCTVRSWPSGPWIALRTIAVSSTARQIGPSLSMVQERAMAPVRGNEPKSRTQAGCFRIELMGKKSNPAFPSRWQMLRSRQPLLKPARADDPLDPCLVFQGFRVMPPNHLSPVPVLPA